MYGNRAWVRVSAPVASDESKDLLTTCDECCSSTYAAEACQRGEDVALTTPIVYFLNSVPTITLSIQIPGVPAAVLCAGGSHAKAIVDNDGRIVSSAFERGRCTSYLRNKIRTRPNGSISEACQRSMTYSAGFHKTGGVCVSRFLGWVRGCGYVHESVLHVVDSLDRGTYARRLLGLKPCERPLPCGAPAFWRVL